MRQHDNSHIWDPKSFAVCLCSQNIVHRYKCVIHDDFCCHDDCADHIAICVNNHNCNAVPDL